MPQTLNKLERLMIKGKKVRDEIERLPKGLRRLKAIARLSLINSRLKELTGAPKEADL